MPPIIIRDADISDSALILKFITELAIFENAEKEVKASEYDIQQSIFGSTSTVSAVICEQNEKAIGFAVYFYNYSTWLGKNGLFLEDLYITPEARGTGAGKALLKHLAKIAIKNDCGRFEWNVLDWNDPAIKFYDSIGARPQAEWIGYRLTGQALIDLSKS